MSNSLHATTARRTTIAFTPANGAKQSPNVSTAATLPNNLLLAPQLIGVDAIPFTATLGASPIVQVYGFPNLVKRDNNTNPINPTQGYGTNLHVDPQDRLVMLCFVQMMSGGVAPGVIGQAVGSNGIIYSGPFLGPGDYQKLQAQLTLPVGSGTVQGWIVALMSLSMG